VEQGPKISFEPKQEKLILDLLEGLGWNNLTEDEKRALIEIAAAEELSSENQERIRELLPPFKQLNDADKALFLTTLEELGFVTREEIEKTNNERE
jgi:uncharacterized protein YwgA